MNRETTPPLDVLMAASLYLMTRYAEEQRPETAVALAQPPVDQRAPGMRSLGQGGRTPLAAMSPSRAPDIPALSHPVHTATY